MQSIPLSGLPIAPAVLLPTDMLMMCRDGVTLEKVPYSQVAQALGQMYWGSLGAFTVTTANFTQPSSAGTVSVSVVATAWMSAGQFITIASGGLYQVSSITNSTTVVLLNTGWTGNAAASTVIPASSAVAVGGAVGPTGSAGTNGVNAYTTLTASFTQPAVSSTVAASVASTAWMSAGQVLYVASGGYYSISSITNITTVVLTNLGYAGNASPTSTVANASAVSAAGLQAPSLAGGTLSGALNDAAPVSIASASTVAIGAAASNQITITGTTPVTGFDTIGAGAQRWITAAAALPIAVGSISLTMAAGDVMLVESLGGGTWKMQGYFAAGGAWQNVASINGGASSGLKEMFINPLMQIAQRVLPISSGVSALTYTLDRWVVYASGAAVTVTQGAGDICEYALTIAGAASNTACNVVQRIESFNAWVPSGTTITVKAHIYTSVAFTPTWEVDSANAIDNFSSTTAVSSGSFGALSVGWNAVAFTFTTNSACQNGFQVQFMLGATTSGVTKAVTATSCRRGNVLSDTNNEYRPLGLEMMLCQRYRCSSYAIGYGPASTLNYSSGHYAIAQSTSKAMFGAAFPAAMRSTPTITIYNYVGTAGVVSSIDFNNSIGTSVTVLRATNQGFGEIQDSGSGFTTNTIYWFGWVADAEL